MSAHQNASSSTGLPEATTPRKSIAVLIMPGFNLMATTGFLDPFRAANYLSRDHHFDWHFVSPDGGSVIASNGMTIADTISLKDHISDVDIVVVSSSWTPEAFASPPVLAWLRQLERRGAMIGGIDTGAFILAYASLLNGHAASVHFEHHASFTEIFPTETLSRSAFNLDTHRFSSAGGTAALELGTSLVATLGNPQSARDVSEFLYHHNTVTPPDQKIGGTAFFHSARNHPTDMPRPLKEVHLRLLLLTNTKSASGLAR